jgi:hypothetical protein
MMESRGAAPGPAPERRQSVDNITVLLGVITIVSGVATGLFSDLRFVGQVLGLLAFAAWVVAIWLLLWNPASSRRAETVTRAARTIIRGAFVLTVALLLYAFVTGPRLTSRTLVLTPSGAQVLRTACPRVADGSEVAVRIALSQLGEPFVHVEILDSRCERANQDIRIRSEDLQAVLPAP